jgi:DNA mismatch repair ATPase MutL
MGGSAAPTTEGGRARSCSSSTVRLLFTFPLHLPKAHVLVRVADRLVDCTPLKRAFEAFYTALLPKGSHPFVYLSLEINPAKVDVNVHPTKREVGFEDEDEVVELICDALGKKLEKASESRSFKVQASWLSCAGVRVLC